jgi:hypothetical protein
MTTNGAVLTSAFNQWANRPADQRYNSLDALHAAVLAHRQDAGKASVNLRQCDVLGTIGGGAMSEPVLVGPQGQAARFTHWSFGQLCRMIEAPAAYLRKLAPSLAAENIRAGIAALPATTETSQFLFGSKSDKLMTLRALTSDKYTRIWNSDVTSRLIRLREQNPEWQEAPAAFDGSRGMYASDADMFAFMVNSDRRIFESLPGGGLSRGFFVSNSEVGAQSFVVTTFLYEYVCGNHRVWGAKNVREIRIRHVGNADERAFRGLTIELKKYADKTAGDDERVISEARRYILGSTKEEVLDKVFGLSGAPRKLLAAAYDVAVREEEKYGDPHSVWGFNGGLTQVARDLPNASDRVELEAASADIMAVVF